jgi:hypothetical protein
VIGLNGNPQEVSIAQSLVAKVQLGLAGTVTRLGSKMRFVDQMAPLLRQGGVVRSVEIQRNFTIRAAGIATAHKSTPAFGGGLYCAGALRQDIFVDQGSIYRTFQDSMVDIDEFDDTDLAKKMKFIHISQTYSLLTELMREADRPQLIIVDTPLILEHSDVPMEQQEDLTKSYHDCLKIIAEFWNNYQRFIYPFSQNGVFLASLNSKRFGAIFYGLTSAKRQFIIETLDNDLFLKIESSYQKIKKVGLKKLLNGVLTRRTRTAAFEYDMLTERNRIQPKQIQDLGLIGFHFRAGLSTLPYQVEMIGSKHTWDVKGLDDLASYIVSLITIDQPKALPLPLWFAKYGLKPISSGALLNYYKAQAREMIKNEAVENIWKEELDFFEEEADEQ